MADVSQLSDAELLREAGADIPTVIKAASTKYGIPETLMNVIIKQESGGNQSAVSPKGAKGIMQLMPGTARDLGVNRDDPIDNILGGAKYLKQQYDTFGTWDKALWAYNAGPERAKRGIMPTETKGYLKNIMGAFSASEAQAAGMIQEPARQPIAPLPNKSTVPDVSALSDAELLEEARKAGIYQPQSFDSAIDTRTGVPASVRGILSDLRPEDKLRTLRKFYPDVRPHGDDNFVYTNPKTRRPTLVNPKGLDIGDVAEHERSGWQGIGGVAGGAVAAGAGPAAPLTVPIGIGLGAVIGGLAYDIKAGLQGRENTRTLPEQALGAATDFTVNAAAPVVFEKGANLLKTGGKAILGPVRNRLAGSNASQLARDYAEAGIRPVAGPISGNRFIQGAEEFAAGTPGGARIMQEAAETTRQQTSQYAEEIASKFGPVKTVQETGEAMLTAAKNAVKRFKDRSKQLYDGLYKHIPEESDSPISNTLKMLDDEIGAYSATPELGKRFNKGIADVLGRIERDAPGGVVKDPATGLNVFKNRTIPFKTLQRLRSDIGDALTDSVNAIDDLSTAQLKKLYGALSDDLRAAAAAKGPDALKAFETANRYYSFNMNANIKILDKVLKKTNPEDIYSLAMQGSKQGGTTLLKLRQNFTSEEWDVVAGTVLGRLGRAVPSKQDVAGEVFSASTFLTNWSKLSPEAQSALFGGSKYAALRPELDRLLRIVGSQKDLDAIANTSKTGTFNAIFSTLMGPLVAGASAGLTTGLATAGVMVGGQFGTAKLLTSPKFVKWLADGAQMATTNPNGLSSHVARLAAVAAAEPKLRNEIEDILESLSEQPTPKKK